MLKSLTQSILFYSIIEEWKMSEIIKKYSNEFAHEIRQIAIDKSASLRICTDGEYHLPTKEFPDANPRTQRLKEFYDSLVDAKTFLPPYIKDNWKLTCFSLVYPVSDIGLSLFKPYGPKE
jgi:hypothetical protein